MDIVVNRKNPDRWKEDSEASIDMYNAWFMLAAPLAYREARKGVIERTKQAIKDMDYMNSLNADVLMEHPEYLSVFRACTAPPLAVDRLSGLSHTHNTFIKRLEGGKLPTRMSSGVIKQNINSVLDIINHLLDKEVLQWVVGRVVPTPQQFNRATAVIADRITGALADPVIRNAQESRQLQAIANYLTSKGYTLLSSTQVAEISEMPSMTFAFHVNVPVLNNAGKSINMPIDVVIQPASDRLGSLPILVECKSAGDVTNPNKRRKEELTKIHQLRTTYHQTDLKFILFLCGYFDAGYLGYEAAEGIDWVWEHRVKDFEHFGI